MPVQAGRVDAGPPTPPPMQKRAATAISFNAESFGGIRTSIIRWLALTSFLLIFFIAHAQMEGWYDRQLVCPRYLYIEVLVPTQQIWVEI